MLYRTIYRVKLVKTEYVLNEKYFSISIRSQKYIFFDRNLTLAIIIKYNIKQNHLQLLFYVAAIIIIVCIFNLETEEKQ